jgi:hypothetical protein
MIAVHASRSIKPLHTKSLPLFFPLFHNSTHLRVTHLTTATEGLLKRHHIQARFPRSFGSKGRTFAYLSQFISALLTPPDFPENDSSRQLFLDSFRAQNSLHFVHYEKPAKPKSRRQPLQKVPRREDLCFDLEKNSSSGPALTSNRAGDIGLASGRHS